MSCIDVQVFWFPKCVLVIRESACVWNFSLALHWKSLRVTVLSTYPRTTCQASVLSSSVSLLNVILWSSRNSSQGLHTPPPLGIVFLSRLSLYLLLQLRMYKLSVSNLNIYLFFIYSLSLVFILILMIDLFSLLYARHYSRFLSKYYWKNRLSS